MSWTSRLTRKKGNIGHDEVKISADRYLALERSVEELKLQNESLNATNKAQKRRINELQKQLDGAREELFKMLRGFQRLPEDLKPVPDEAAAENVKRLVENLNEQIDQTAASITMDTIQNESPSKAEKARGRIATEMGAEFLDFLDDGARERATASIHLRVGVQAYLVRQCGFIVNKFVYAEEMKDNQLRSMYLNFFGREDNSLLTMGWWTSIVKQSIRDIRQDLDETGRPTKLMMKYVLPRIRSIMVVMGCSRQNTKVCLEAHEERVAHCIKAALDVKTEMDKVISPNLYIPWLLYGRSTGDESEAEEVDKHMNLVHQRTLSRVLCPVALGLASWEYDPATNGTRLKVRKRTKYISVLAVQTTRNPETRVIRNEVAEQPTARTSSSDKVPRASSNPVADDGSDPIADDGPSLGSDPIDDDDD